MNDVKGTFVLENAFKVGEYPWVLYDPIKVSVTGEVQKRLMAWYEINDIQRLADEYELKEVKLLENHLMGLLDKDTNE